MSYILDALKRADAERERGHVPGLHSRSAPTLDRPGAALPKRWLSAGWIGLTLLATALGLRWWQATPREAPAPMALPATPSAQPPAAAAPPDTAPTAPGIAWSTLPILAPEPPRPPRPPSSAVERPAQPATAAPVDTAALASAAPNSAALASTATTTTTASPVRGFAELTPDVRARLPAVNVSGSTFSQNPAHRMLIVNGKVVQEGGEIAPGLQLETIEQRSAVLNHQGLRYRIGY